MRPALLLLLATLTAASQPSLLRPSEAAPGSWLDLEGFRLSATRRAWQPSDFRGAALPLSIDGISVKINGKSAPIAFVSDHQITILVPPDTGEGSVPLELTTPAGLVPPTTVFLQPIAPRWLGSALRPNGAAVTTQNRAEIGEIISAFATGFGPTSPAINPMVTFQGAAPLARPQDLSITVGGQKLEITFAGLVSNGLYQVNFVVPPLPEYGSIDLVARIGDIASPHSFRIPIIPAGPPVLTSMSPSDFIWGQRATIALTGNGLSESNTITFSDPDQLTIVNQQPVDGSVFQLLVGENAAPGERTLTVTTSRGTSNPIPFTIRRGTPKLTTFTPSVLWPGRLYAYAATGEDLAGVKSLEVTPDAGIRLLGPTLPPPHGGIAGTIRLDDTIPPGPLAIRALTATDVSEPFDVQVTPAPAVAPAIGALTPIAIRTYNANIQGAFSGRADYTGEFEFTDTDADIKTGSRAEMIIERTGGLTASPGEIELLPTPGKAKFTFTHSTRSSQQGPFTVWISLIDEAGNRSNARKGTIDTLYF